MLDYQHDLNPAQYEAATTLEGPVLVIAGAGSGKTRTIVYRLARLVESGVPAASILLLTFTRKAAQEMLDRARRLLSHRGMPPLVAYEPGLYVPNPAAGIGAVQGGTFHSYAYSVLRIFPPNGYAKNLTVMDSHDILAGLHHCRDVLNLGKGDRSFPRNQTIQSLISKSRNKEQGLEDIIRRDAAHLMPHAGAIDAIARAYAEYKKEKSLLDYDDLLFSLEEVLRRNPRALAYCRKRHQYIMVDEYQDTNPVQARIAALVAGLDNAVEPPEPEQDGDSPDKDPWEPILPGPGNLMVVGDDAQSIYAFRGADVRNILRFPELYPKTRLIRLEENYRSTQPVLNLANAVLSKATEGFAKRLFTRREDGMPPNIVRPLSDRTEAGIVASRIVELLRAYPPSDIAVLFRAGFHSYALELQLSKLGIAFRKYGGIRYAEAAHIKDAMSFMRLVQNPLDFSAFVRMAEQSKGVGAKTCLKLYQLIQTRDSAALAKALSRFPDLDEDLAFIGTLRGTDAPPARLLSMVLDRYNPRLRLAFPDDWPKRQQGLEQLVQVASMYEDLDLFIADLSLEDPLQEAEDRSAVTLSTIHSAKGLEWSAVLLLDVVEDRFPSRHALVRPEDYEEERRLMYVACTRAREVLEIYVPASVYDRGSGGSIPALPSPFVRELTPDLYLEWQEGYTGGLVQKRRDERPAMEREFPRRPPQPEARPHAPARSPVLGHEEGEPESPILSTPEAGQAKAVVGHGFCKHRVFGRGKIVQHLPPDKYRVNFPGIGLKVIMAQYLSMEE